MIRHAVLGAGGVGGLVAAYLARCGFPVTLVLRPEVVGDYPDTLELQTPTESFRVAVEHASRVPTADVLWVAVKATQLEPALAALKGAPAIPTIVPLLNGVEHVAALRSVFGADRVVAATIAAESERVSPGHILQRSSFVRLRVSAEGRARLAPSLDRLQALGVSVQFVESEATLMWSKLAFLAPFALATAATGKTKGELQSSPVLWPQVEAMVREACAVARAEGAAVDPEQVLSLIAGLPQGMRSSMQRDVEQGKVPELDAIAGPAVRGGSRHGIETPVTRALMDIVAQRSARPPGARGKLDR